MNVKLLLDTDLNENPDSYQVLISTVQLNLIPYFIDTGQVCRTTVPKFFQCEVSFFLSHLCNVIHVVHIVLLLATKFQSCCYNIQNIQVLKCLVL